MLQAGARPFLGPAIEKRWLGWRTASLGRSGATIVEAEMEDWSGAVPPSRETVIHVLLPGQAPASATRDLGDGRGDTLVRPGQVCVTPASQSGCWTWRGRFRDLNLVLPAQILARTADDAGLPAVPNLMPLARAPLEDTLIEAVVHRLGCAMRGETHLFTAEIDHAVALVCLWLLRRAEPSSAHPRGGLPQAALRRVRAYVEAHLSEDISVADLADLAGLSTPYFSHAFRASMGEAPYRYVLRRRCHRACELLRRSDPLSTVALAVGFGTQAHFTTTFRRVLGMTPAAWRRENNA